MARVAAESAGGQELSAYGLRVRFELAVPELAGHSPEQLPAEPWLTVAPMPTAELERRWTGSLSPARHARATVDGTPWVVEHGRGGDVRMWHGLARFHIDQGATMMGCDPRDTGAPAWRRLLLDTALVTASLLRGFDALHAAAVATPAGAVAIVGPAGAGKTTLATELVRRGSPLLADDVVVLERDRADDVLGAPGPPLANVPAELPVDGVGTVLHRFGDERWLRVDTVSPTPVALSLLVFLRRDRPTHRLTVEPIPAPAVVLLAHALDSGSEPARRRARLDILSLLARSARAVSVRAGRSVPAAEIADRVLGELSGAGTALTPC